MSPRRVLIVRIGAMGDVLHALPAVTALRQRWPEAEIDWAVDRRWAPLLAGKNGCGPVVSRVHLADTRSWSHAPFSRATAGSVLRFRRELREGKYRCVVDMQGTLRSAVIGRFGGAPLVGFADPRESAARMLYRRRIDRRGAHVVEQGAALLGEALDLELTPIAPELPRDPEAETWAETVAGGGRRVALLAPTAGWGAKQWPAARFAALARELDADGWKVLINTATPYEPTCAAVAEASGRSATPVHSEFAQLIALVRRSDLVVGGDSGPVHLAAALGRPVVGLYGPTDPARNGPWGPGSKVVLRDSLSVTSHKRIAAVDPGLERIGVEQVLQAVRDVAAR